MSVLSIGSMNLDYTYRVPHLVCPGETLAATDMTTNHGGKGLNQALALSRAGARVRHAGCIGSAGTVLRDFLAQNGVDVSLVREVDAPQGSAFIQVDETSGQNSIVIFGGSNRALTAARIGELLDAAFRDDTVLLQNEISAMDDILAGCADRGLPVVLNPAPFSSGLLDMNLSAVRWFVVNEVEAAQLTGEEDPDAAWEVVHARWPQAGLVVTLGEQGSICFCDDGRIAQAAYPVEAVDTTAAGDTFIGYFVAALEEGRPLANCLRLASRAAAIAVTRYGAAPSIPWRDELRDGLSIDA